MVLCGIYIDNVLWNYGWKNTSVKCIYTYKFPWCFYINHLPTTDKCTLCPMGGVVPTWHSYVPESLRCGYRISRVQSSVCGEWMAENLWSDVYVNLSTVSRWMPRCLIHDTCNNKPQLLVTFVSKQSTPQLAYTVQQQYLGATVCVGKLESIDCYRILYQ